MALTAVSLTWNPTALNGALRSAFDVAARQTKALASARNPAPSRIGIRLSRRGTNVYVLEGKGGLAHLFEGGVKPHTIAPLYYAAGAIQQGFVPGTKAMQAIARRTRRFDKGGGGANYALKFRTSGRYGRASVQHPGMRAQPYIHPAAAAFPTLYRRAATSALMRRVA